MEQTPHTAVKPETRAGEALSVRRLFTQPGVHPFETLLYSAGVSPFKPDLSGTNLTSRLIFEKLGVKPEMTTFDQASSYARLKSGEIQAAVYVAGQVKLDVEQVSEWLEDPEGRFEVKGLIMHELGHVVGLDHIDDRDQLMHATAPVYEMQDGDRAGFALLGTGPCVPEL